MENDRRASEGVRSFHGAGNETDDGNSDPRRRKGVKEGQDDGRQESKPEAGTQGEGGASKGPPKGLGRPAARGPCTRWPWRPAPLSQTRRVQSPYLDLLPRMMRSTT